jgi:outer membrane immunogenic protein
MTKLIQFAAAGLTLSFAGPALAADLTPYPVKAPFVERFSWTGCYAGGQIGGMWSSTKLTDPVAIVQESILPGSTVGTTTAGVNSTGFTVGGQIGCDYQFNPSWVMGIEGAAVGATTKATSNVALQNPGDFEAIAVRTDLVTSVTGRLGYAVDRWLIYGKGGVAWASNKYSITGSYTGTAFDAEGLDTRIGWTAGAGVEWAFAQDWSARLEYDYYDFGTHTVNMIDAANAPGGNPLSIKQTMQTVKLGVNFHVWAWQ